MSCAVLGDIYLLFMFMSCLKNTWTSFFLQWCQLYVLIMMVCFDILFQNNYWLKHESYSFSVYSNFSALPIRLYQIVDMFGCGLPVCAVCFVLLVWYLPPSKIVFNIFWSSDKMFFFHLLVKSFYFLEA